MFLGACAGLAVHFGRSAGPAVEDDDGCRVGLVGGVLALGFVDALMEVLHGDADGIAAQFGHIVALQEKDVPFGIFLWQDEWLVRTALLVEVGDEGTRVVPVQEWKLSTSGEWASVKA